MTPPFPGQIGDRLLPSLVDYIAATDPDRVFCSFTKTKDPADGFHDVTYSVFARAIDHLAWYLEDKLGCGKDFPTLLYMGPQDMMYAVIIFGTIKAGYKALLTSPFDSLAGSLHLLQETNCNTFLVSKGFDLPVVKQIPGNREMRVLEITALEEWLHESDTRPYPFHKTFESAKYEPCVVVHTSGSTGMPKPVVLTHATWISSDMVWTSSGPVKPFQQLIHDMRVYNSFPVCHAGGLIALILTAVYGGNITVLAAWPPTADLINSVMVHGNIQAASLYPRVLIELSENPEYLKNLSKLESVLYAGGTIPEAVGDVLSTRTCLINIFGMTEAGVVPIKLCEGKDWKYVYFCKEFGHELRQVADDLYELVIVKNQDPEMRKFQGIFGTYPDIEEYKTHDLFSKHPTKEDYWLYRGRSDDMIVLGNGRNVNPVDVERAITSHPIVNGSIVAGMGRSQLALLIETVKPPSNEEERERLVADIWSTVEAANEPLPVFAKIDRDMILFTSTEKPMLRAGKGTLQRQMTLHLYQEELDRLYEAKERERIRNGGGSYENNS